MSAILLKFIHVIAIAGWSAGLISLPFLYGQRQRLTGKPLHQLHNFTRFFYVSLISPIAFVAVVSGTTLIFVEATFAPWFSVKLALVMVLVVIHVMNGLMILRLFRPDERYPSWRVAAVVATTTSVIGSILVVVLGKPAWLTAVWITDAFAPGALGALVPDFIAWWR
ncbi:CopD family protein [Devosia sp.]|uniref:CopD family protein n=1 Tax=Devosia sp. TaxID=1871048 RepID=UPI003A928790